MTINSDGSSAAYIPIELRKITCTLALETDPTISHAVKIVIRIKSVRKTDMMMMIPIQKSNLSWFWCSILSLIWIDISEELKRTLSSVPRRKDMNTIFDANRCVMKVHNSPPFSLAQDGIGRNNEKHATNLKKERREFSFGIFVFTWPHKMIK